MCARQRVRVLGKVARTGSLLTPVVNHNAHCVYYSITVYMGVKRLFKKTRENRIRNHCSHDCRTELTKNIGIGTLFFYDRRLKCYHVHHCITDVKYS